MRTLIVLFHCVCTAYAATHSLQYVYTATSGIPGFPEFVTVGLLNGVPITHYDSVTRQKIPRQDWMKEAADPDYWKRGTKLSMNNEKSLKADIGTAKQRFNQTGGMHTYQKMYGCTWDEETGATEGLRQYGYDGEDFLVYDMKTFTWIAPRQQAEMIQRRWNSNQAHLAYKRNYITQTCINWLKKYLEYGKSSLKRIVPSSVSLLQKTPSSPVTCHATGFYPSGVILYWRRDGQEVYEDVEHRGVLSNHDGTFQKSARLTLKPEDWEKNQYECVVQLSGMEDMVIKLERSVIKTNGGSGSSTGLIIGIIVGALVVVLAVAVLGPLLWKKFSTSRTPY